MSMYIQCIIKIILIFLFEGISVLYLDKYTKYNNNIPLDDFIHNISSKYIKITNNKKLIKDILCYLPLLYMILKHPSYICKYVDVFIILRLLRIIFNWITILPLVGKKKKINNLFDVFKYNGGNHDLMFSGHTIILLVGVISYMKYYKINLNMYIILYLLITSLSIIIVKEHYTIDVLTSYFVTYSVLKYHNLI